MKKIKLLLMLLISISITLYSCNSVKLNNAEAESLVKKTLQLPEHYRTRVGLGVGATSWLDALQKDGLIRYRITYSGPIHTYLYLRPTDLGKPYYLGRDPSNSNIYWFRTNDIDFDTITGIAINKESQTATIRFSLKATNITPIARTLRNNRYLKYSLDKPIPGELVFRKFDNGWQLQSNQNKTSTEIVNEFLK